MSQIKCKVCGYPTPVSEEDPDASLSDAFEHIQRRHADQLSPLTTPVTLIEEVPD